MSNFIWNQVSIIRRNYRNYLLGGCLRQKIYLVIDKRSPFFKISCMNYLGENPESSYNMRINDSTINPN